MVWNACTRKGLGVPHRRAGWIWDRLGQARNIDTNRTAQQKRTETRPKPVVTHRLVFTDPLVEPGAQGANPK